MYQIDEKNVRFYVTSWVDYLCVQLDG